MQKPICILIIAHSHEVLLRKLIDSLKDPAINLFVHIDMKSESLFQHLTQTGGIQLIQDRVNVSWAHISQVEAVLSSYNEIRASGFDFSHFLVISGQDYPIQPVRDLVRFLAGHPGKSFVSYAPLSKNGWAKARKRYRYYYYIPGEKLWRAIMMLTGIHRRFPLHLKPYGGAQWINLAREHMDYIFEYCQGHEDLMKFMRTTRFPEEMLFQTLLLNSRYDKDCINNDLRFVKWEHAKSNPNILTGADLEEIKRAPDKFFARKFDLQQSAGLLELLNEPETK